MNNLDAVTRNQVAVLARALYAHEIDYTTFLSKLPAIDRDADDAVTELLDLIAHEPARGRVIGLPPNEHAAYIANVERRIADLSAAVQDRDRHS